jgi:hypothetical protein
MTGAFLRTRELIVHLKALSGISLLDDARVSDLRYL